MHTSFWSHFRNLVRRLQQSRPHAHRRRRTSWVVESLEARALLSATPAMFADINPGAASANPTEIVPIGSVKYFTADDGVHGQELWKSDGTAAGTTMLKDIFPGSASSNANSLTNVNGTLYFAADGLLGRELWKSDGTANGTMMVADISLGSAPSDPNGLTNVNGTLFFAAHNSTVGWELWKSDGTTAGTTLVKDIAPGSFVGTYGGLYPFSSTPANLTNVNGTLFFDATDGTHGYELWQSDGTAAGTTLFKDIDPGFTGPYPNSSIPTKLTQVNGTRFFSAIDRTSGGELWKTDGTAAGTTLVKDIFPGFTVSYPNSSDPNSSGPSYLTDVNGTLFFSASDSTSNRELWKSDGTAAGTTLVKNIAPDVIGSGYYTYWNPSSSNPTNLTNVNGMLFFTANDTSHGSELWKSDGTAAGTTLVKDINQGGVWTRNGDYYSGYSYSYAPNSSNPGSLKNVNGTLFFTATDGTHGYELWQSDGTTAGTVMVADLNPGSASSSPGSLTNVNGTLFFGADDGIHGAELWTLAPDTSTPASILGVNGFPATTAAGAAGTFTVTAKNIDGTTNAGYKGTVHFTSSDAKASLPANYTFTAADAGVRTFSVTLKTAGTQSITAADTLTSALTATEGGIMVKAAAASTMTVAGFPSTTTAGIAGNVTVSIKDPYGNIATSYRGTVHVTSSDTKAVLPGNYAFTTADAGKHTFSVQLKTAGTQSIKFVDTTMPTLTSTEVGIIVKPAVASQFLISVPSSVKAGVGFSLTLMVEDAFGNVVTGYTGKMHFTSADKTALLPANYTFTAADKGVHTFSGLVLNKKGNQKITLADTVNSSLTASVTENVR